MIRASKLVARLVFAAVAVISAVGSSAHAASQGAFASTKERLYFRLAPGQSVMNDQGSGSTAAPVPVSFALTEAQKQALFTATNGQVDFRNIVQMDADSHAHSLRLMGQRGYDSTVAHGVLPPVNKDNVTADPALTGQWWITADDVPAAWNNGVSGKGVTVADCDSGIYDSESDLKNNLLMQYSYDLADKDAPTVVNDGQWAFHGTAVAAIIAGVKDGQGTNGIAFDAKYIPLQNFNYDAAKDDLDKEEGTARCILRALNTPGVNIIVLENQTSGGSSETFVGTREAVKLALLSGVTIVSAGGNYTVELTSEAANDTHSIIVGALGQDAKKAGFSNFGTRIAVSAFGENLHTLYGPNGAMGEFGGTSGATPQVAATVALMLEANPALTPAQIKEALIATRITNDGNKTVGGQLDTAKAVEYARTMSADQPTIDAASGMRAAVNQILGAQYPVAAP